MYQNFLTDISWQQKHLYIYIYIYICVCVFFCVCVYFCVCFNVILISAEIRIKWTLFLQFQQHSLYAHFFYFLCVTCFTQHINIYWKTRKILLEVQITKHLIVHITSIVYFNILPELRRQVNITAFQDGHQIKWIVLTYLWRKRRNALVAQHWHKFSILIYFNLITLHTAVDENSDGYYGTAVCSTVNWNVFSLVGF